MLTRPRDHHASMHGRFLRGAARRLGHRGERARDHAARVRGIDDVVDLEVRRGAHAPCRARYMRSTIVLEERAPLGGVGERGDLLPEAELHRALEAHAAELAGRPRHREEPAP